MNPLRQIIQIAAGALLLFPPLCLSAGSTEASYQTRHVGGLDEWSLIFPAEKGKATYVDYRLALEIVEIECDGKKLEPMLVSGHLHVGYETYSAADPQTIYMARFYELRTAVFEGRKLDSGKVLEYPIPQNAQRMVLKYRVRYPDDSSSGIITMISEARSPSRKNAE